MDMGYIILQSVRNSLNLSIVVYYALLLYCWPLLVVTSLDGLSGDYLRLLFLLLLVLVAGFWMSGGRVGRPDAMSISEMFFEVAHC